VCVHDLFLYQISHAYLPLMIYELGIFFWHQERIHVSVQTVMLLKGEFNASRKITSCHEIGGRVFSAALSAFPFLWTDSSVSVAPVEEYSTYVESFQVTCSENKPTYRNTYPCLPALRSVPMATVSCDWYQCHFYIASTDKVKRYCHVPGFRRNCTTDDQAVTALPTEFIHTLM
jgi:hypothetical protein